MNPAYGFNPVNPRDSPFFKDFFERIDLQRKEKKGFCKLIVHGGAGDIGEDRIPSKKDGVKLAAQVGFAHLVETDNVVEAVVEAIKIMEDDPAFNAGYGSCLTDTGDVEMDAIVIKGSNLKCGAVGAIKNVQYPINVAKRVMENTNYAFLCGAGAEKFARSQNIPFVPSSSLITDYSKAVLERVLSKQCAPTTELSGGVGFGTVGAVAMNSKGEIAAATSTGGITGKMEGRVGDTPIIGGGTFCDDEICGISATGLGESIMKSCLASKIAHFVQQGMDESLSCCKALENMKSRIPEGDGGAILISNKGKIGFGFNSKLMAWAYADQEEYNSDTDKLKLHFGVRKNEHDVLTWQI